MVAQAAAVEIDNPELSRIKSSMPGSVLTMTNLLPMAHALLRAMWRLVSTPRWDSDSLLGGVPGIAPIIPTQQ
jgi:hypothetical protein